MRFSSKLSRALWRLWYVVPLTPLGLAVVLGALWLRYGYAVRAVDFVLYAASTVALLLVGCAVVLVAVAAVVLALRLRRIQGDEQHLELESGVRAATGFSFPRFLAWPMVEVRLSWARPTEVEVAVASSGGRVQEVVTPALRGSHRGLRRRFIVRDIFGLSRIGLHRESDQQVHILPGRAHTTAQVVAHVASGEGVSHPAGAAVGELLDIRRYTYGDPLRHVLWKAYARARQLLVRTPEAAIMPTPSAAAYFVAGEDDEPVASLARLFLEQGWLGDDFVFGADGCVGYTSRVPEAIEQIVESVHHRRRGAQELQRFLRVHGVGRSCLLFVPPTPGSWLNHVVQLEPSLVGVTVVLAIDADAGSLPARRWKNLLVEPLPGGKRVLHDLARVVRSLTVAGLHVRVIHRPTGELLHAATLEALTA